MPTSKHRRKSGGKAVRHPGRNRIDPWAAAEAAFKRFSWGYKAAFHERVRGQDSPPGAEYLLDIIVGEAFQLPMVAPFQPVSRAEAFRQFIEPFDPEDPAWEGNPAPKHETLEDAEAALAFLVAHELVEVTGDEIRVPARFWDTQEPSKELGEIAG